MLRGMSTRDEIIAVASSYLDAGLVNDEADGVHLAADCRRWTQQSHAAAPRNESADEIRAGIRRIENRRWLVDGNQAVVIADIWYEGLAEPIVLFERFRVEDGAIREIEGLYLAPQVPRRA